MRITVPLYSYTQLRIDDIKIKYDKKPLMYGEFSMSDIFDISLTRIAFVIRNIDVCTSCVNIEILNTYSGKVLKGLINDGIIMWAIFRDIKEQLVYSINIIEENSNIKLKRVLSKMEFRSLKLKRILPKTI